MTDPTCLFCKIATGQIPATLVHQDEEVVAFQDIAPQAPVHLVLIPRVHVAGLNDVTPEVGAAIGKLMLVARDLAKAKGCAGSGWRLVSNCGPDAGQTIHHLHFHLLGGAPMGGKMV